jgi:hypothetical protein
MTLMKSAIKYEPAEKAKPAILAACLLFACLRLYGQQGGSANFCNNSSTLVTNGPANSPVAGADGIKAALYWAPLGSNTLVQIGAATNVGVPLPGLFAGGTRMTGSQTSGGATGQFQVKAWAGGFATFELAVQNGAGVLIGQSAIIQAPTGNPGGGPPTPPASLVANGLQSFTLAPASNPPPAMVDIGLRAYDGTTTNKIAAEPLGQLTSPVRLTRNGTNYGIPLVATNAPNASKIRIQTSSGIKAWQKLP